MRIRLIAAVLLVGALSVGMLAAQQTDYSVRVADLERRHAAEPNNVSILDALAGSYAMAGRYRDAVEAVRELALLEPDVPAHRVRLAHLYAWSGDPESALRELNVLGDKTPADAAEFKCNLQGWSGDSRGAARCFSALANTAAPGEAQAAAELGAARNMAWSGDAEAAIRHYRSYLAKAPQDTAAAVELARVLRYHGRLTESQRVLAQTLKQDRRNAPALALLSEVLHWMGGRSHQSLELAREALSINPNSMEARVAEVYALRDLGDKESAAQALASMREQVRSDGFDRNQPYAPGYTYLESTEPSLVGIGLTTPFSTYNDSDGIHQSLRGVMIDMPVRNHVIWVKAYRYEASAPDTSIFSFVGGRQYAGVLSAGGAIRFSRVVGFEYSGGAARTRGVNARPVYSAALRFSPGDRMVVRLEASRSLLTVTPRSIGMGIASTRAQASVELTPARGTSIALEGDRSFWNDGNRSTGGSVQFSQTFRPASGFFVRLGPRASVQSFAQDRRFTSGFFTPDWNDRYEAFGTLGGDLGRWVSFEISPSAGAQRVARSAEFRQTWEISSALTVRIGRVVSLSANYERRNYSLIGGTGYYQGAYFQLHIQSN